MAVSKGNVSSTSGNTDSLSWSHTVPSGSNLVLVVGLCLDDGITASGGVLFNTSESLTLLRRDQNAGAAVTEIWYLVGPTVTTANIVASLSGKAQNISGAVDFAGADTPDNATGSTPDVTTSVSDTVAGSDADNFIFDCVRKPGAIPTEGADQTADWNIAAVGERGAGSTQDGVNGGVMSWSSTSDDCAHTACRIPELVVADNSSSSSSSVSSSSSISSSSISSSSSLSSSSVSSSSISSSSSVSSSSSSSSLGIIPITRTLRRVIWIFESITTNLAFIFSIFLTSATFFKSLATFILLLSI